MRRRRLLAPSSRAPGRALVADGGSVVYLRHVVSVRHPVRSARLYLRRALGNPVRIELVEAARGERVGVVREVEVVHHGTGERSWVRGARVLPNGDPAGPFVPDHLVHVQTSATGPAARGGLGADDTIVLHVPVRSYLRFLPAVYQGEGPVTAATTTRGAGTALQRAGGGAPLASQTEAHRADADALRRFLFVFQHLMTTVSERIDDLEHLTDPMRCEPTFLPWLASWVGYDLDASLPVHQQRELVRRAIRLYRTRGTRSGIEEMVGVLTSAPVRVRERAKPAPMVLGRSTLAGGADVVARYEGDEPPAHYLYDAPSRRPTAFFELLLEAREAFRERFGERGPEVLRRIVDVVGRERPAHVWYTLRFDDSV